MPRRAASPPKTSLVSYQALIFLEALLLPSSREDVTQPFSSAPTKPCLSAPISPTPSWISEDGSRISHAEMRADLLDRADSPFSYEDFKEAKNHVVAMGAAEKARGPEGGLKAAGVEAHPWAHSQYTNGSSRKGNGTSCAVLPRCSSDMWFQTLGRAETPRP